MCSGHQQVLVHSCFSVIQENKKKMKVWQVCKYFERNDWLKSHERLYMRKCTFEQVGPEKNEHAQAAQFSPGATGVTKNQRLQGQL